MALDVLHLVRPTAAVLPECLGPAHHSGTAGIIHEAWSNCTSPAKDPQIGRILDFLQRAGESVPGESRDCLSPVLQGDAGDVPEIQPDRDRAVRTGLHATEAVNATLLVNGRVARPDILDDRFLWADARADSAPGAEAVLDFWAKAQKASRHSEYRLRDAPQVSRDGRLQADRSHP
jgi:hypothetical protein